MFNNRIISISVIAFSCIAVHANSIQKIEVLNDSAQALHIAANNAGGSFNFAQVVPAFVKAAAGRPYWPH